jgi:hypothetical protein
MILFAGNASPFISSSAPFRKFSPKTRSPIWLIPATILLTDDRSSLTRGPKTISPVSFDTRSGTATSLTCIESRFIDRAISAGTCARRSVSPNRSVLSGWLSTKIVELARKLLPLTLSVKAEAGPGTSFGFILSMTGAVGLTTERGLGSDTEPAAAFT